MAIKIELPFHAFSLRFANGENLCSPVNDMTALRWQTSIASLAGEYRMAFEEKVLNKGNSMALLMEAHAGDYQKSACTVSFKAAKDGISFPEFELVFEYYYQQTPRGCFAIIPMLGLECFSANPDLLNEAVSNAVKLDFAKNKRLRDVRKIVAAIWLDLIKLSHSSIKISVPDLKALDDPLGQKKERLLERVAKILDIDWQVVYGRTKELEQASHILKGNFSKNLLLVGPSGVGKTAMIWELARRTKSQSSIGNIWETNASVLIKELTGDTGWQHQLSLLCEELSQTNDVLFIRNFLELFEIGQYEGNQTSVAEYLRPYISSGQITLFTESTEEELSRIELRSPNYPACFQIIRLEEPRNDLEEIIIKKVNDIARRHNVLVETEAIKETIRLNRRFTPYAGMPGKPIRFLEGILINYFKANPQGNGAPVKIGRGELIAAFCEETALPPFMVDPTQPMKTPQVRAFFKEQLYGQDASIERVVNMLAAVKTALTRTGKPISSFLFVGPTGVGKTEMAKLLSQFMFGDRNKMTRFDMSEYADPYAVSRLVGTGYFSDGLLSSAVRQEPFSLLLFDEIEKAHPSFYDLLLQILGEGRLTDSRGKLVNFCSTIIIMTSNIGAGAQMDSPIGYTEYKASDITAHYLQAVQKHFRPELFNRIDEVIPFEPLGKAVIQKVVTREIELLKKREGIRFRSIDLQIDSGLLGELAKKGFHPKYGARYLQRSIRQLLINPLAKQLNYYNFDDQLVAYARLNEGRIDVKLEADPLAMELLLETLEKIRQSDLSSDSRRNIQRLMEGQAFLNLLNQLDILEQEKEKEGKAFWQNVKKATTYSNFLNIRHTFEKLKAAIEQQEEYNSLVCLDMETYKTSSTEDLKAWKGQLYAAKLELYQALFPAQNRCFLGIYGRDVQAFLRMYKESLLSGTLFVVSRKFTNYVRIKRFTDKVL